ncbi:MAG: hypothetical protein AAF732_13970 [Pseudomonadota bacterium]
MKSLPFSITPILMTALLAGAVGGAVVGAVLAAMGLTPWFWATLCGVLPGFVVTPLRASMEEGVADLVDAKVPSYLVSAPACMVLSVVASLIAAFLVVSLGGMPVGYLAGALIGLLSGSVIALVMTLRRTVG